MVGDEFGGSDCCQMVKGIKCLLYKSGPWRIGGEEQLKVTGTEVPAVDGNKE